MANTATIDASGLMATAAALGAAVELIERLDRAGGIISGEFFAVTTICEHGADVTSALRRIALRLNRSAVADS